MGIAVAVADKDAVEERDVALFALLLMMMIVRKPIVMVTVPIRMLTDIQSH